MPNKTRRVCVLGGKGDIGSAIAARFSAHGDEPLACGRSDFDLTDEAAIGRFFTERGQEFEVLVHSAGLNHPKLFEESTDAEILESWEANVQGFLHVVRKLLPFWKKSGDGRILVISSLYGSFGRAGRLPYVMSKHALIGAVKTLAIEFAPYGVLVNALSPGYIDTKMTRQNNTKEKIDQLVSGIPLGRLGTPEEIAEVAWFLCSEENRYITGQDVVVDGGFGAGGFQS